MTISKEVRRAIGFGVLITLGAIVLAVVPVIAWLAMDPVTTRSDTLLRAILLPLLIAPIQVRDRTLNFNKPFVSLDKFLQCGLEGVMRPELCTPNATEGPMGAR